MTNNSNITHIYSTNGVYLGFVENNNLYSRDSLALGWVENGHVWKVDGTYAGEITHIDNHDYILRNSFTISPISKGARKIDDASQQPEPQRNIAKISAPLGFRDGIQ